MSNIAVGSCFRSLGTVHKLAQKWNTPLLTLNSVKLSLDKICNICFVCIYVYINVFCGSNSEISFSYSYLL